VQKGTTMDDTALDKLLEEYRDALGVYSDRRNELHRDACVEVWKMRADLARLQAIEAAVRRIANTDPQSMTNAEKFIEWAQAIAADALTDKR
jgi:hypothetical protein